MKEKKSFDWFGFFGLLFGFAALCISLFRTNAYSWDFAGTAISAFGFITAILIAWQIKTFFDFTKEKEDLFKEIDILKNELVQQGEKSDSQINRLTEKLKGNITFISIGLAETSVKDGNYEWGLIYLLVAKGYIKESLPLSIQKRVLDKIYDAVDRGVIIKSEYSMTLNKLFTDLTGDQIKNTYKYERLRDIVEKL